MSDLAGLLVAIATVVSASASAFALVWTTVRSGRKSEQVAKSAADDTAAAVVEALADGELSPDDVVRIREAYERREQDGGGRS